MAAHDVYTATLASAPATKAAAVQSAQAAFVSALTAAGPDVGLSQSYTAYAGAVRSANNTKSEALFAAEQARQSSYIQARDALRVAGDSSPTLI